MEDLATSVNSIVMCDDDLLSNTTSNYSTKNLASNIHPRLDAYKRKTSFVTTQEERRKLLLIQQKQ